MYSSSPLKRIISGAMNPSVPPNPFVPDGRVSRLIPEEKKKITDHKVSNGFGRNEQKLNASTNYLINIWRAHIIKEKQI